MAEAMVFRMQFHGRLLRRGFWLYVWDIRSPVKRWLYVGRTGDSSSAHASSPFSRIGQHLDFRENAKANSMARRLAGVGIEPECCEFSMIAIGPLFPEQPDFDSHVKIRDRVGALESMLADYLRSRGYFVLGTHGPARSVDQALWTQISASINSEFPALVETT